MDEVKQFADLSMGWCINCHRSTRIDSWDSTAGKKANQFYTIYKYPHRRSIDAGAITVETIGETECQKCHY